MTQVLETSIEETVEHVATLHGWLVRKIKWLGRRAAPDRLFAKGGRFIFIEFKRPDEKPTIQQAREHKRLLDAGFEIHTCDSVVSALRVLGL